MALDYSTTGAGGWGQLPIGYGEWDHHLSHVIKKKKVESSKYAFSFLLLCQYKGFSAILVNETRHGFKGKILQDCYKTSLTLISRIVKTQRIHQMSVVEMRMLRWMSGNTWKYRIQNEKIRLKIPGPY